MKRGTALARAFQSAALLVAVGIYPCSSAERPPLVVPFTVESRLPAATLTVDGKALRIFLDTGAFSLLSLRPSALGDLPATYPGGTVHARDDQGKIVETREFVVPRVVLGDSSLGELHGYEFLDGQLANADFAGLLGFGLFRQFLSVFDYPAGRLSLYRSGDSAAMAAACGPRSFSLLTINNVLESVVDTEQGSLLFQWDTGSTENVIRPAAIGLTRSEPPTRHRFRRFTIGGKNLGPQLLPVREFQPPNVDGVLGTPFLESHVICLDPQQGIAAIR